MRHRRKLNLSISHVRKFNGGVSSFLGAQLRYNFMTLFTNNVLTYTHSPLAV